MAKPGLVVPVLTGAAAGDAIMAATEVIGDAWSWLILREAVLYRVSRFGEFQDRLGISRATLTARLGQLSRGDVLVRDPSASHRYCLTTVGEDFFGPLMAAQRWGDTWRPREGGSVPVIHSGHLVSASLRCRACGQAIAAREVRAHREDPVTVPLAVARRRPPDLELLERAGPSSIAHALTVTADWWSTLIIREMFFGARRFDDLQRRLGIAPNVLSARLRHLTGLGVLRKAEYQAWPVRHEYRLTDKGLDYYPIPLAMAMWGRNWIPAARPEPRLTHICGHEVMAEPHCEQCGQPITRHDVGLRPT
jgi:DNA-binding HxlR family transcriptional regulator